MIYHNLVGVAIHIGRSSDSGHYISLVRVEKDGGYRKIDDMDLRLKEPTLTAHGVVSRADRDFNVGCGLCVFE